MREKSKSTEMKKVVLYSMIDSSFLKLLPLLCTITLEEKKWMKTWGFQDLLDFNVQDFCILSTILKYPSGCDLWIHPRDAMENHKIGAFVVLFKDIKSNDCSTYGHPRKQRKLHLSEISCFSKIDFTYYCFLSKKI